jgi:hypothetical protein
LACEPSCWECLKEDSLPVLKTIILFRGVKIDNNFRKHAWHNRLRGVKTVKNLHEVGPVEMWVLHKTVEG